MSFVQVNSFVASPFPDEVYNFCPIRNSALPASWIIIAIVFYLTKTQTQLSHDILRDCSKCHLPQLCEKTIPLLHSTPGYVCAILQSWIQSQQHSHRRSLLQLRTQRRIHHHRHHHHPLTMMAKQPSHPLSRLSQCRRRRLELNRKTRLIWNFRTSWL